MARLASHNLFSGFFLIALASCSSWASSAGTEGNWETAFPAWDFHTAAYAADSSYLRNGQFLPGTKPGEIDAWKIGNPDLVALPPSLPQEGATVTLSRAGVVSGKIEQEVNVEAAQGRKMAFTYEAKVRGGVAPFFIIESLDGPKSMMDAGTMKPTAVLAQFNAFGCFLDFRYGRLYNIYLGHLYREEWQPLGAILTIPKGVKRIKIKFEAVPAHYRMFDKRENIPRDGAVIIRHPALVLAREQATGDRITAAAEVWKKEAFDHDSFLYLSYVYNQGLIEAARIQMRLWQSWRQAEFLAADRGEQARDQVLALSTRLHEIEDRLAGLRQFYLSGYKENVAAIDLTLLRKKFPASNAAENKVLSDNRLAISLYIQELIDGGYQSSSATVASLRSNLEKLKDDSSRLADSLAQQLGGIPADLGNLDLTQDPSILPNNGHCPPILFATGNTGIPLRVYKDLGVDIFSMNYSEDALNEAGMRDFQTFPAILEKYHLKELSAVFTPVHGWFAVSSDYLTKNSGRLKELLRVDADGRIDVTERVPKTGAKNRLHPKIEEFQPKPDSTYVVPVDPLSPEGSKMINERMQMIGQHISTPLNKKTEAVVELSAEATPIIGALNEPWTQKAFQTFLEKKFGSLGHLNELIGSNFSAWNEIWEGRNNLPEARQVAVKRLETEFVARADAAVYQQMRSKLRQARPDITVINRDNSCFFADFSYQRIPVKDDYIDYHASYDRSYGYWLGRYLGKDHITGEEMAVLPTGLRERHTLAQAYSNALKYFWKFAQWGTKSICIWRPYPTPVLHSIGPAETNFTIINENWAALPVMKSFVREFGRVLDGEVIRPKAGILQLEQQGHVSWYMPGVQTMNLFWQNQYVDFAYVFEQALLDGKDKLSNYSILAVPSSLFVSDQMQKDLLEWVNQGGVLVTFGPLGLYNEYVRPSQLLMNAVFGPADYHLVGAGLNLSNHDGYWLAQWKQLSPTAIKIPMPEDINLPDPMTKELYERKYNRGLRVINRFVPTEPLQAGQFAEQAVAGSYGKGYVVYIPREFLPEGYGRVLTQWLSTIGVDPRAAWCSEPSFSLMRRKPSADAKDERQYFFVQNQDEWSGLRRTRVSLRDRYSKIEDVSDRKWAVPLVADFKDGITSFDVILAPGEIAVFRLTPGAAGGTAAKENSSPDISSANPS